METQGRRMHFFSSLFLMLFACWLKKKEGPTGTSANLKMQTCTAGGCWEMSVAKTFLEAKAAHQYAWDKMQA